MKGQFKFPKHERLKSPIAIGLLFKKGKVISRPPLFVRYELKPSPDPSLPVFKIAFSVAKRNFKRAVDRNRIKRLLREAFRLNAFELRKVLESQELCLSMMIVYSARGIPTYEDVESKVISVLKKLAKESED